MTDSSAGAIDALARRLLQHDEAMRDGAEEVGDAEPSAIEFIAVAAGARAGSMATR